MQEGTVYVLEHVREEVRYAEGPDLSFIRKAILDLTEQGKITEADKNLWAVFAMDAPGFEPRALTKEETVKLLPMTGPGFKGDANG